MAPEENDIVYNQYGLDIVGLVQYLIDTILGGDFDAFVDFLETLWNVYSVVAILLSILFFAGFIYAKIRYNEVSEEEQELLRAEERKWALANGGGSPTQGRWAEIQKHIHEDSPASWKIAIIEADIFLDEVLSGAGYSGMTIGDKLKSANTTSFTTIQDAWEAHKVRNEIAHTGGDFVLTKRLAQETLTRYERVFREFGAI